MRQKVDVTMNALDENKDQISDNDYLAITNGLQAWEQHDASWEQYFEKRHDYLEQMWLEDDNTGNPGFVDVECYQCGELFDDIAILRDRTQCTSHIDGVGVKEVCLECAVRYSFLGRPTFTKNPFTNRSIKVFGKTFDKLLKYRENISGIFDQ